MNEILYLKPGGPASIIKLITKASNYIKKGATSVKNYQPKKLINTVNDLKLREELNRFEKANKEWNAQAGNNAIRNLWGKPKEQYAWVRKAEREGKVAGREAYSKAAKNIPESAKTWSKSRRSYTTTPQWDKTLSTAKETAQNKVKTQAILERANQIKANRIKTAKTVLIGAPIAGTVGLTMYSDSPIEASTSQNTNQKSKNNQQTPFKMYTYIQGEDGSYVPAKFMAPTGHYQQIAPEDIYPDTIQNSDGSIMDRNYKIISGPSKSKNIFADNAKKYGLNDGEVIAAQNALYQAGLLNDKDVDGLWGQRSMRAYEIFKSLGGHRTKDGQYVLPQIITE